MDWIFALWGNDNMIRLFPCIYLSYLLNTSLLVVALATFSNLSFSLIFHAVFTKEDMIESKKKKAQERRATELLAEALRAKEVDPATGEHLEGAFTEQAPPPPQLLKRSRMWLKLLQKLKKILESILVPRMTPFRHMSLNGLSWFRTR